ncbi:MAG: ATPase, T2SS/T4P/T4SS family, partial [Pseudomonadota bacterium]|nr:ATPase, T2SS/T4P/T4SS family [Pseudomonadota bacterium]
PAIGFGFAEGVRTLLRQDPDIIMVGEIRDRETADIAVQAALTGHLVLSTIHTNDAPSAVTRLLELGMAPYLLNSSLLGVLAQRLVRRLCPFCKQASPTDSDAWQALITPFRSDPPAKVYQAVGCEECRGTGYRGRLGIYELMQVTDELRALITPATELRQLQQYAIRQGTTPLRIAGARKVAAGHTAIEEVIRVVATAQRRA